MEEKSLEKIFGVSKPLIGMIHLAGDDRKERVDRALEELDIYESEGINGAIIENYHGSEIDVAETLKIVQREKRKIVLGVNILPNEFSTAFVLAEKFEGVFIQLDYIAGTYSGGKTLKEKLYSGFRKRYPNISVLGGVHPKYYEPIEGSNLERDLHIGMERADAIVVTGSGTGKETPLSKIQKFREVIKDYQLVVGAGINVGNAWEQMRICDAAIVGTEFKYDHPNRYQDRTRNKIDKSRVKALVDIFREVRSLEKCEEI